MIVIYGKAVSNYLHIVSPLHNSEHFCLRKLTIYHEILQ